MFFIWTTVSSVANVLVRPSLWSSLVLIHLVWNQTTHFWTSPWVAAWLLRWASSFLKVFLQLINYNKESRAWTCLFLLEEFTCGHTHHVCFHLPFMSPCWLTNLNIKANGLLERLYCVNLGITTNVCATSFVPFKNLEHPPNHSSSLLD